jgi:lysophospholipase L1-like esterase
VKPKTKKIITIIAIGVILIGVTSFVLARRKNKPSCKDKILFLGNSQTANSNGYVERLQKHCNSNFTKISKVGAKSDWILQAYKDEVAKGNKYDWVSIMIGGNDIFARKSIEKTKKNLDELFDLIKENKSKILVMSSPTKLYYNKTDETHLELADDLEKWLDTNKKVDKFIPITKLTESEELFASDNLHLNSKGQEVIFQELLKKGKFK